MNEEQLAIRAGTGDPDAFAELAARMHGLVRSIAARYYAPGLDHADLLQIGFVGLWKGCRNYRSELQGPDRNVVAFLAMCVHRNLKSEVKTAKRLKHQALAEAVSLDAPAGDPDSETDLHGAVASTGLSAHELLEQREDLRTLLDTIRGLTPLERESLIGVVFNGESYLDVEARIVAFDGDRPGRAAYGPARVVDNALSRARSKIRLALAQEPDRLPLGAVA